MAVTYNIPVDIPQIAGAPTIDIKELKSKVQEFVNGLYIHVMLPKQEDATAEKKYSKRLLHLRELSKKTVFTDEELRDDRLAYLLSK